MIQWNYKNENNVFINREENGVPYLSFAALEETGLVVNGFSTRLGGASKGKYATMNFAYNKGDDEEAVLENYTRMAKALGSWLRCGGDSRQKRRILCVCGTDR